MATNNNNINNIITTNKHKLKIVSKEQSLPELDSVKEESKASKINHCSQDLPADWQWMKLDLFDKETKTGDSKIISMSLESGLNSFLSDV